MTVVQSSFWTAQDWNIMEQMNTIRSMVRAAEQGNELVREVKATCDAAGLLEKDYLYVLSAKLIEKYDELAAKLLDLNTVQEPPPLPPLPLPARSNRKILLVMTFPTEEKPNEKFKVLCDDGTIWMHGGHFGWGCVSEAQIP